MMSKLFISLLITFSCIHAVAKAKPYDIVVAKDGSGDYRSIQEAINSVEDNNPKRTIIFVKKGVYHEHIEVPSSKINLSLIGENVQNTVIIDTLCVKSIDPVSGKKLSRIKTTTFVVFASDFYAENITIENNSQIKAQALALSMEGPRAKFKNCRLLGFQDTMYLSGKSYFRECYIAGTTDFIYGPATAVFEDCNIHSRGGNYITASSAPENSKFGFIFLNCRLTSEPGILTYLGRPWRAYANVVYINCEMGGQIRPEGWNDWGKAERHKTVTYAEYHSRGPGANVNARVNWSLQLTAQQAKKYSVRNILSPNGRWNYRKP